MSSEAQIARKCRGANPRYGSAKSRDAISTALFIQMWMPSIATVRSVPGAVGSVAPRIWRMLRIAITTSPTATMPITTKRSDDRMTAAGAPNNPMVRSSWAASDHSVGNHESGRSPARPPPASSASHRARGVIPIVRAIAAARNRTTRGVNSANDSATARTRPMPASRVDTPSAASAAGAMASRHGLIRDVPAPGSVATSDAHSSRRSSTDIVATAKKR